VDFSRNGRFILADRQRRNVRHHNVDAAEFDAHIANPLRQRRAVRDVHRSSRRLHAALGQCGNRLRNLFGAACTDRHIAPLGGEVFGDGAADAFGAAGN
jgi:hypothetical protein